MPDPLTARLWHLFNMALYLILIIDCLYASLLINYNSFNQFEG